MQDYYEEMLKEIRQMMAEGQLQEAAFTIRKELSMPYIPADVEPQLKELQQEVQGRLADAREVHEPTMEELLQGLKGSQKKQLSCAYALSERNLRSCLTEIRNYLSHDPCPEAAGLLINALAEQEIAEEFVFRKNGLEYTFWSDAGTPVAQSSGFRLAMQLLQQKLQKEPAQLEMGRSILIHEAFLELPLSISEEEAAPLAEQVAERVEELLHAGQTRQPETGHGSASGSDKIR